MSDAPLFEVTTPAANAAARRLTTALKVTTALKLPDGTDTALIESIIDSVSGECARYCNLARPANWASPPTFGQEVVKATWLVSQRPRRTELRLPWRAPISGFGQVVEAGVNLAVNVDYRLVEGGMIERIRDDSPVCWSCGKIVVPYTAGWVLPDNVPAEIEGQVVEQVKMRYLTTEREPGLRSENEPDVYSATYAAPGGDTISERGLLYSLEAALKPLRIIE